MHTTSDADEPATPRPAERTEASATLRIPLLEDRLTVTPRTVELGTAQVHKRVEEHLVEQQIVLQHQELDIERVPVDHIVETAPEPFWDGDTLVVPVVEEEVVEVVVRRRLRVVEEVRLTRRVAQRTDTVSVPLRRERVEVAEEWGTTTTPAVTSEPEPRPGDAHSSQAS